MRQVCFGAFLVAVVALVGGGCDNPLVNTDPTVTLSVDNTTILEDGGTATVTATLDSATYQPVTVHLTYGGTAVSGTDYTRSSTTITIPAFKTTGTVRLTGVKNQTYSGDRTILVGMASVAGGNAASGQVSVTLTENEPVPTVTLQVLDGSGNPVTEGSLSEANGTIKVYGWLSSAVSKDVTVNLTLAGTAVKDTNYTASDTKIVIPAGKAVASITLTGVPTQVYDNGLTVVVTIASIDGATEVQTDGKGQLVTVYISDQQDAPTMTLSLNGSAIPASGGMASLVATLSKTIALDATVDISFAGTAVKDTNYSASATTIVIPAGQTSGAILLTAKRDSSQTSDLTIDASAQQVHNATGSGTGEFTVTVLNSTQITNGQNKERGQAFLAYNATLPGVTVTASGLQYKVLTAGTGAKPTATDTVIVKYTGTLVDGTQFDSSNGQTITFGVNQVIAGWTEALQLMPTGSRWMLYIPYDLAYGDQQRSAEITPFSALIFDVELVGIQ